MKIGPTRKADREDALLMIIWVLLAQAVISLAFQLIDDLWLILLYTLMVWVGGVVSRQLYGNIRARWKGMR